MLEFWTALPDSPLARNAVLLTILASVACGVVGTYVVTRRITYVAAGIAHAVLAGLGAARYLQSVYGWEFLHPLYGAFVAAIGAALVIGYVALHYREREDTVIGALWALGMAVGILFIYKTPGYNQELMGYLFGNILLVSGNQLVLVAALDAVIVALTVCFYPQLQAVCFDEEFARLRNLRVGLYYNLLLVLTAITVVLLVSVVGIVLVIALLTLPVAIAGRFTRTLAQSMVLGAIVSVVVCLVGLSLSYGPDLPPGPTIIVVSSIAYGVTLLVRRRTA